MFSDHTRYLNASNERTPTPALPQAEHTRCKYNYGKKLTESIPDPLRRALPSQIVVIHQPTVQRVIRTSRLDGVEKSVVVDAGRVNHQLLHLVHDDACAVWDSLPATLHGEKKDAEEEGEEGYQRSHDRDENSLPIDCWVQECFQATDPSTRGELA